MGALGSPGVVPTLHASLALRSLPAAADKFSFANGTGTSKKGGKRRPSVGRAIPRRRR